MTETINGVADIDPYASVDTSPVGYQSFVKVAEFECSDGFMELPREKDGTVLLSTVTAQFPNATGLRYKSASGNWRGIRAVNNVMDAPDGGWGDHIYFVTGSGKRKSPNSDEQLTKKKRDPEQELLQDLIVKNLSLKATEKDLADYFSGNCGELAFNEVKLDPTNKESRGFGFIRFKSIDAAKLALSGTHVILGQQVEVQKSIKRDLTLKLFVGRLPQGTTQEELKTYFEQFGELIDAFVPNNFRGFGFVTYADSEVGRSVLMKSHEFKGTRLNVTRASPRDGKNRRDPKFENASNGRPDSRQKSSEKPAPAVDMSSKLLSMLASTLGETEGGRGGRNQNYDNSRGYSNVSNRSQPPRIIERSRLVVIPPKPVAPARDVNTEIISLLATLIGGK